MPGKEQNPTIREQIAEARQAIDAPNPTPEQEKLLVGMDKLITKLESPPKEDESSPPTSE